MRIAAATLAVVTAVVLTASVVMSATRDKVPPVLDDVCNSACPTYGTMHVNVDITEEDVPTLPGEAWAFYSTDGQASWTEVEMTEVPGFSGGTWGASFPVADQDVRYHFLVLDDTAAAFSAPVNDADGFPPPANLMFDPGTEVDGDVVNPRDPALDLDGFRAGYSDSCFYATLSNATDTWPTRQTILGPWYIYSMVVDNPDAGEDSLAFAMVYADVPLIADAGLYVVDARDTTYTRIADIDVAFSGGDLHMRCARADLEAHPSFGPDNPSGYISLGVGTAVAWLADLGSAADETFVHSFYLRTDVGSVGPSASPVLSSPGFAFTDAPPVNGAVVRFAVTYSDPDGDLPTVRQAVIDGVPYDMGSGPAHDYVAGVEFSVDVDVTLEDHSYCFSFSDGIETVQTAVDTIALGSGVSPWSDTAVALNSVWPRPASDMVNMSFVVPEGCRGRVDIYDTRGRLVRRVWSGAGGRNECCWDGLDESGARAASGVYFVRLESPAGTDEKKLVLLR